MSTMSPQQHEYQSDRRRELMLDSARLMACAIAEAPEVRMHPTIPSADRDVGDTLFPQAKETRRRSRILLVDDEGIMRDGLCALLGVEPECEIVGATSTAREAIRLADGLRADLIVIDPSSSTISGTEAIAAIKQRSTTVKVLVLTFRKDDRCLDNALRAGADGYVLKTDSRSELLAAIRHIGDGKTYLSPSICDRVVDGYVKMESSPRRHRGASNSLSEREREVIKLIAGGFRTREIAAKLSLSHKTIEKHRSNLMRKLGLRSAAAVAAYAMANGFIDP